MAESEFDLTEYNGGDLVITAAFFLALSWLSVGLRTYTRAYLMKCFQADDWLMLIAQAIFTLSCAFILEGVRRGLGRHNDAVTDEEDKVAALMWQALAAATYVLDMMLIKLSIGIFLLRLSVERVYTWILRISLVVITIWSSVSFLWSIFQCSPVEKQWDFRIQGGHCAAASEVVSAAYAISVMTILSDWLFALLPIPMLWRVKMTKQAKATVIVILGLGVFASVATLVRIKFLSDLEKTDDILYAGTDAMVWTLIEPGVAIIASSLATIRPLLRAMKITGFEYTEYGIGTNHSAAPQSSVLRSLGNRSKQRSMPGYGPDDVSLADVELNHEAKRQVGSHDMDINVWHHESPSRFSNGPSSPGLSEIFVIQGHRSSAFTSPWISPEYSSPNRSSEQIHSLEAQSQETPRFGLGDERK